MNSKKNLIILIGPPAVGKMTVGKELSKILNYKLFHNHKSIDPFIDIFDFKSPSFKRLSFETRDMVFREFVETDEKGLIYTMVINFDVFSKNHYLNEWANLFKETGGNVYMVELLSSLKERKKRNKHESRILEKSSKRDLKKSEEILLLNEKEWNLKAPKEFDFFDGFLSLNNEKLSPSESANIILKHFKIM